MGEAVDQEFIRERAEKFGMPELMLRAAVDGAAALDVKAREPEMVNLIAHAVDGSLSWQVGK